MVGSASRLRDGSATLLRDGEPIARVEIAASYRSRTRGLLGRDGIDGAILLTPSASVHTVRMRFAIDVAYLTKDLRVISVVQMRPNRVGMVRPRARHVLEAEWGAFAAWGIRPGAQLAISELSAVPSQQQRAGRDRGRSSECGDGADERGTGEAERR